MAARRPSATAATAGRSAGRASKHRRRQNASAGGLQAQGAGRLPESTACATAVARQLGGQGVSPRAESSWSTQPSA